MNIDCYELGELIFHTLEMYIYMADINKKEKNFREAFLFLYNGNEYTKFFEFVDVNIFQIFTKVQIIF